MDPRIERHAEVVVEHCIEAEAGDNVVVKASACADDLVVAVNERLGAVGARPMINWLNQRANRAYLRAVDPDDCVTAEHELAAAEAADAFVVIDAHGNVAEHSDSPADARQAVSRATEPIRDAVPDRSVYTRYPGPGDAQRAEMSTEAYEDFVWNAIDKDWDEQHEFQQQLVEILDPAEEVRIVSGEETDLRMSVAGMDAVNEDGRDNLPGGEVYTAPVPDSVEGTVRFDLPFRHFGRTVEDAYLFFEDGEVVDHDAGTNPDVLADILAADEGARRVGELGVGMNRDIDRVISDMLFDEKMGGTVHLALGWSIDDSVPEGMDGNESSVHVDMLVDVSEDSYVEVDGEVVQRNGTFVFEDGFDG